LGLGFSEEDVVWTEGYNFKRLMFIQIVMISRFSIEHIVCSEREEQCEKQTYFETDHIFVMTHFALLCYEFKHL
jgi:hypothetical protein